MIEGEHSPEMGGVITRARLITTGYLSQSPELDSCLLYTSDAADERSSVDLGGRRIIKKKKSKNIGAGRTMRQSNTCPIIDTTATRVEAN